MRSLAFVSILLGFAISARPQTAVTAVLFQNVRVFNGTDKLSAPTNVLVVGGKIAKISTSPIATPDATTITTIDGAGRTLMPGLIDAHVHMMFNSMSQMAMMVSDIGFVNLVSGKAATGMLMRGYTSVRDLGGPPRIWPSGAMISQSRGHGDFRLPTDLPAAPESFTYSERIGAAEIADDAATVRRRVRE
jgi:imidazolonepropionase-like amidohydrolase